MPCSAGPTMVFIGTTGTPRAEVMVPLVAGTVLVAWGIFYLTRVLPISKQELIDARRNWWIVRDD
ncbi:hypothetical protein [Micromonospora avicenniae]|uniref:hypothetical protein n=1 Tax=Micromonospora avicenniae TaxID=1198245 RepID=UPI00331F9133